MDSKELLIKTKYHLSVSERLFEGFIASQEKRFLFATIKELAKASSSLIRWSLLISNESCRDFKKNTLKFEKKFSKIIGGKNCQNILKILELERDLKKSPIIYTKKERLILLADGKYKFLKPERISDFKMAIKESARKIEKFFT